MKKYILIILFWLSSIVYGSVNLTTARIAYLNEKDYDRARQACLKGIEAGEQHFELYLILCGCEIAYANWREAADALNRAFMIDSTKSLKWIDKKDGRKYFGQAFFFAARDMFMNEAYKEALNYLNQMPLILSPDASARILKGALLYKLGDIEQANAEYKAVLIVDPRNPDVHFLIGKALFEIEEYDSALTYFDNGVKNYLPKYTRLLSVLFQNKLAIDTTLTDSMFFLWAKKDIRTLDNIFKSDLGYIDGFAAHSEILSALSKAGVDLARAYYYAGMAYYKISNDSLALQHLLLCLELKPDDTDALFFAGEILVKTKAYDKALKILERATSLNTHDQYAWFYLGACYTRLGRYEQAIGVYENKMLPVNPQRIDIITNLAYVYAQMGNYVRSNEYLKLAEEIQKSSHER